MKTRSPLLHGWRGPALLLAAALVLTSRASGAAPPMTVIDTMGGATNLTVGMNGTLYWTELLSDSLGYRTPSGTVGQIALPPGTGPLGIATAADGTIWFTEDHAGGIGRYNPNAIADAITEWSLSPTSHPVSICAGPDGNMWFAESVGNAIGRITLTGAITRFPLPTASAHPNAIALGADGHLWFTENSAGKIGRIGTTGAIQEYEIPSGAGSDPSGIALGPDGKIWFTERGTQKIGRLTRPLIGSVTIVEFPLPPSVIVPDRIVAGPDGALWFTTDGASLGRISTSGEVVAWHMSVSVSAVGRAPDGALWFSEPSEHHLCRVSVAGDVNRDGSSDVTDVFYLINYLFANGPVPK